MLNCVYCGKELKGMTDARLVYEFYFTPAGKAKTTRAPACLDTEACERRPARMMDEPPQQEAPALK